MTGWRGVDSNFRNRNAVVACYVDPGLCGMLENTRGNGGEGGGGVET